MDETQPGTFAKSVHSGKWMIGNSLAQKGIGIVTFLILAHLLSPTDFGLIAVIFIVVSLFDTFTSPGFEAALIQGGESVEDKLDAIWTFNLLKGAGIWIALFLFGPQIAAFFHAPEATALVRASGIIVFLQNVASARQIYFFKNLDFQKVFWRDMVGHLAYPVVAILWAVFVKPDVWALFYGHVAKYVVMTGATYVLAPYRPRLSLAREKLAHLFRFGRWITAQNILGYLLSVLDNTFVGRLLDVEKLGVYSKARDLSYVFVAPFFSIVSKVGFPAYSRIQHEPEKVREGFLRSLDVMVAVNLPVFLALTAEGGTLVHIFLGAKWGLLVLPLKILAASTIFSSLVRVIDPIVNGIGRPEINVRMRVAQLICAVPLLYFGVTFFGLRGAAWGTLAVWILVAIYAGAVVKPLLSLRMREIAPTMLTVLFAIAATLVVAVPTYLWFGQSTNMFLILPWLSALGALYAGALLFFGKFFTRGPRQTIVAIWKELV